VIHNQLSMYDRENQLSMYDRDNQLYI